MYKPIFDSSIQLAYQVDVFCHVYILYIHDKVHQLDMQVVY
jgi:hypothetical protein